MNQVQETPKPETEASNAKILAQPEIKENISEVKAEPETQEQINWKKFREQREIERRQKEEAERKAAQSKAEAEALKAALDSVLNKNQARQNEYVNNGNYEMEEDLTEDERIQKKVEAALSIREQQMEQQRREREQAEMPQRLVQSFSDFNNVCTTDNLDYLEYHYPEVATAFKNSPDSFDKWAAVYKAVKRFVPNTDSRKDQKKADQNFNKPQSMAVPGSTQVGDTAPIMLDDKRRADNWSRMQKVMKGGR
jgi:hypothetical protein